MQRCFSPWTVGLFVAVSCLSPVSAAELFIGTAKTSITPDEPVALTGHVQARISREVETPCTASVLVIEAREGEKTVDELILVSADLVMFRYDLQDRFREYLIERGVEFDVNKVILTATHTHTAPAMLDDRYTLPNDCMKPSKYVEFLKERLAEAIDQAWKSRKRGGVSWGFGHAVVERGRQVMKRRGVGNGFHWIATKPAIAGGFDVVVAVAFHQCGSVVDVCELECHGRFLSPMPGRKRVTKASACAWTWSGSVGSMSKSRRASGALA